MSQTGRSGSYPGRVICSEVTGPGSSMAERRQNRFLPREGVKDENANRSYSDNRVAALRISFSQIKPNRLSSIRTINSHFARERLEVATLFNDKPPKAFA